MTKSTLSNEKIGKVLDSKDNSVKWAQSNTNLLENSKLQSDLCLKTCTTALLTERLLTLG